MKHGKYICSLVFLLLSHSVFACDEQCLREQAETALNKKFPGYLNWQECDRVAYTFMTSVIDSLSDFKNTRINTKYKGPLKNIRAEINKQKSWLEECNVYLRATNKKYIFESKDTTQKIYSAIDAVSEELTAYINGVTYSTLPGEEKDQVLINKFNSLIKAVDDHKTLLHLKGRFVTR